MKYWSYFQALSVAVTLGPVLIVLCFPSVWIELQVRILSLLCCTDLTVSCISQVAGDLSRILLLLLLLMGPLRSRTPCSGPGTPCPSFWCARWSPRSSSGWWRQSSTTSTGGWEFPGPSNVASNKTAVLFCYIFKDNIERYCLNRRLLHRVLFSLFITQFSEYPSAHPSHGQRPGRATLDKSDFERNVWGMSEDLLTRK